MMTSSRSEITKKVFIKWDEMRKRSTDLCYFTTQLAKISNKETGIFGGAVRDWFLDKTPKDIDLVVKADRNEFQACIKEMQTLFPKQFSGNNFGGNVIQINDYVFDVWLLEDTYSFKCGTFSPGWGSLVQSVPFNSDSIVVLLDGRSYSCDFLGLLDSGEISFVNKKDIRDPVSMAKRANAQSKKYGWKLSPGVQKYVDKYLTDFSKISEAKAAYYSSN